jgi:RNA polymerase sigma factor (sigma-70 family)
MTARRREALIVEHMPAAERIARSLHHKSFSHLDVADLIATGYIGLVEASKRYKPSRGAFGPFLYWRVAGAIVDANRRRAYREEIHESLDEIQERLGYLPPHLDPVDRALLPDAVAARDEARGMLLAAILYLPLLEGAVLLAHLCGETLPQTGSFHQRSATWAQGKLSAARVKVAEQLREAA